MFQISSYILMPFSQLHWQTVRLFFKCSLYHFALPNSSNYFREFLMLQYVCVCLYKFFCVGACMSLCKQMCTLMEARGQHSYFFFFFFVTESFTELEAHWLAILCWLAKKSRDLFAFASPALGYRYMALCLACSQILGLNLKPHVAWEKHYKLSHLPNPLSF